MLERSFYIEEKPVGTDLHLSLKGKKRAFEILAEELELERIPKADIDITGLPAKDIEKYCLPYNQSQRHLMIKHLLEQDLDIKKYLMNDK
jgi:hypothetical protein